MSDLDLLLQEAKESIASLKTQPVDPERVTLDAGIVRNACKPPTNNDQLARSRMETQKQWGSIQTPQTLTEEMKRDLLVIQARSALDPKRHYKRLDDHSKEFQVGTVVSDSHDRVARKKRAETIVESLLLDVQTKAFMKRKMSEIHKKRNNYSRRNSYTRKKKH